MAALPLPLLDALIKGSVLIGLAAGLAHLLRHQSAAARHAVWTAALLAQLALPVLALTLPSWNLPILPRRTERTSIAAVPAADLPRANTPSRAGAAPAAAGNGLVRHLPSAGAVLLAVWLLGIVGVLTRLGVGTMMVAQLARRARRVEDGWWLALVQRVAHGLGISRSITLLRGDQLEVPVTWGTVHPTVLLPHRADEWPTERRHLVLVHELAHVKRFDALTQLIGQIALAIFWMNPLVWLAVRRMAAERERACDDYVLRSGMAASTYAQELLAMVRGLHSGRNPAFAALALAARSDFESRVLAILNPDVPRRALARNSALAMAAIAAVLVLPLASLRPVERSVKLTAGRPAEPARLDIAQLDSAVAAKLEPVSSVAVGTVTGPAPKKPTRRAPIATTGPARAVATPRRPTAAVKRVARIEMRLAPPALDHSPTPAMPDAPVMQYSMTLLGRTTFTDCSPVFYITAEGKAFIKSALPQERSADACKMAMHLPKVTTPGGTSPTRTQRRRVKAFELDSTELAVVSSEIRLILPVVDTTEIPEQLRKQLLGRRAITLLLKAGDHDSLFAKLNTKLTTLEAYEIILPLIENRLRTSSS